MYLSPMKRVCSFGAKGFVSEFIQMQGNKLAAEFLRHGFVSGTSGNFFDVDAFIEREHLSGNVMMPFLDDNVFSNLEVISDENVN